LPVISYFSVSFDLIQKDDVLPYDLYVNASAVDKKQKFIKIFPQGDVLSKDHFLELKEKYRQLYVAESQRNDYMSSLIKSDSVTDVEAANFVKDSAIKYLHNIFDSEKEFSTELLSETISECRGAVENMIDVLDDYSIDSLKGLIGNLSSHDFYTYDHSINVSMYCITIMRALKPNASRIELTHAGLGGLLHDLGKVKIPTHILNCPGGLTDEQYAIIKEHPTYGIDLLRDGECQVADDLDLETIGRIVHEHHENWDGKGYPQGLAGRDIHVLARVCTIADFFDAVTTKRSYSEVVSVSKGIDIMSKFVDIKLDAKIFKVFAAHVKHSKIKSTKELKLSDSFDPSIPYSVLPLEEIEELFAKEDFGKIRVLDANDKKKQNKENKK